MARVADPITICRKEIQAALQIGVAYKTRKYATANAAGRTVTALLISTGGTLHKTTYKFLKKTFPERNLRDKLLTDISVALARGQANLYLDVPVAVVVPDGNPT